MEEEIVANVLACIAIVVLVSAIAWVCWNERRWNMNNRDLVIRARVRMEAQKMRMIRRAFAQR